MITFDEFTDVARKHLHMSKKEMPEERLGSLWCALDADNSNQLQRDEFARFLRLAAPAIHRGVYKRDKAKESTFGALRLGTALACTPTAEMRASLEAPPLTEEELTDLSLLVNQKLEDSLQLQSKGLHGIGNLFADVDTDGSGFITFDEFEAVIRKKLQIKKGRLTEDRLKALWCAIDGDDSNQIHVNEFSLFVKGLISQLLDSSRPRPASVAMRRPRPKAVLDQNGARKPLYLLALGTEEERAVYASFLEERLRGRIEAQAQQEAAMAKRLLRRQEEMQREAEERAKCRLVSQQKAEFKRRMLADIQMQLLRSPIPAGHAVWDAAAGFRLGGGRMMPLYESERLVGRLEKQGKLQWPGRSYSPGRVATPFVEDVSRLESRMTSPRISQRSPSRASTAQPVQRTRGAGEARELMMAQSASRPSLNRGEAPPEPPPSSSAQQGVMCAPITAPNEESQEVTRPEIRPEIRPESREASRRNTPNPSMHAVTSSTVRPMRGSSSLPSLGGAPQPKFLGLPPKLPTKVR